MKQLAVIIICLFACVGGISAQEEKGTWSVSPRIGICSHTLTGMDLYEGTPDQTSKVSVGFRTALTSGIDMYYQASDKSALLAGFSFVPAGFKTRTKTDTEIEGRGTYVSLSLLENYYILPRLALKGGIAPSLLVKSESTGVNSEDWADDKSLYHSFDMPLVVGVSYESLPLVFDLRYHYSFFNAYKEKEPAAHSEYITLTIGCKLNFK